jgi:hypothetical protein
MAIHVMQREECGFPLNATKAVQSRSEAMMSTAGIVFSSVVIVVIAVGFYGVLFVGLKMLNKK